MSLIFSPQGSPVAPTVQARSKAGKEIAAQAQIPLGNGNVLNVPVEVDGPEVMLDHFDFGEEQRDRLELLHKNLGNMLKIKAQAAQEDD